MLPSRAIGNFLFPTHEVVITSLSYSSALMLVTAKCKTYSMLLIKLFLNDHSYLAHKYTTLATRQRDVVVMRTALTAAMVVPSTMFKVYGPPNSETLVSKLFPNFPVVNMNDEAVHIQFPIRKLVFTIIPIAHEGSISYNPNQTHLKQLIKLLLGILETSRQVFWGKLELNSAGHQPSRTVFGHPWFKPFVFFCSLSVFVACLVVLLFF